MKAQPPGQSASATRGRRGSILILVVVVLVLMVTMGAAYIQIARVDRLAVAGQVSQGNIETVVRATVQLFAEELKKDLLNEQGEFFVSDDGDEPYDYPSTNDDPGITFPVLGITGNDLGEAQGGMDDDMWLASSSPAFDGNGNGMWPHITNPFGVFLGWDASAKGGLGDFVYGGDLPREDLIDFGSQERNYDTAIAIESKLLFDADGDGIRDSRLTWAPIRQIGRVMYVMAVRIIDHGAMINLNVATAATKSDAVSFNDGNTRVRGYFPTDLDFSRLARRFKLDTSVWRTEFPQLLDYRRVDTQLPTPVGLILSKIDEFPDRGSYDINKDGRIGAWLANARLYGYLQDASGPLKYTITDEAELRFKAGLNNADNESILESKMPVLLRKDATGEIDYRQIAGVSGGNRGRADFFQGGTGGPGSLSYPAIRQWVTTVSGASVFSPNFQNMHGGNGALKYDLVWQDRNNNNARVDAIRDRLANIFKIGTPTYLHLSDSEVDVVATEFALAIQDYADTDSRPTHARAGDGTTYYGLETLPFLREAYIQIGYSDQDLIDHDSDPATVDYDTYVARPGSEALAVEIGNPFDREIRGSDLDGNVRIVVRQAGPDPFQTQYEFESTSPVDDIAAENVWTLSNRKRESRTLIIVSDALAPIDENGNGSDLAKDLGFNLRGAKIHYAPKGSLSFKPGDDVIVEMQVRTAGGWVAYDRLAIDGLMFDTQVAHALEPDPTIPLPDAHGQGSGVRACSRGGNPGIYYLSNKTNALVNANVRRPDWLGPDQDSYRYETNNPYDRLDKDQKGPEGNQTFDNFQIPVANRNFLNVAELNWIHMFGFSDADEKGTFPERLDTLAVSRRFLFWRAFPPDSIKIPHAAMVMDEFTTLSPRHDQIDNDNADGDDNLTTGRDDVYEQFVPGQGNINTMPSHMIANTAPLPETMDGLGPLAEKIVEWRDDPSRRSGFFRKSPGFASIGELMLVSGSPAENMQRYTFDHQPVDEVYDLYPVPDPKGSRPDVKRVALADTAEDAVARFQFFTQAYTTRSDIYTAYVVILGYQAANFSQGPVESARFYAIFDRSRITNRDDTTRVLGIYRVP